MHNSLGIDNKNSLSENNIKNGDIICFFFEDNNLTIYKTKENSEENNSEENSEENEEINYSSSDEENEENSDEKNLVYKSWAEEFKYETGKKFILNTLNSGTETTEELKIDLDSKDFLNFLNKKFKELIKK